MRAVRVLGAGLGFPVGVSAPLRFHPQPPMIGTSRPPTGLRGQILLNLDVKTGTGRSSNNLAYHLQGTDEEIEAFRFLHCTRLQEPSIVVKNT